MGLTCHPPITAEEFESWDDYNKGYAVYMMGARKDQPNIPERYDCDSEEYHRGQRQAMIDVVDSEG
jgi:hypothetical protein